MRILTRLTVLLLLASVANAETPKEDVSPFLWADADVAPASHTPGRAENADVSIGEGFAYLRDIEYPDASNDFLEFTAGGEAYAVRYDGALAGLFHGGIEIEGFANLPTGEVLVNREYTTDGRLALITAASVDPAGGAFVRLSYWVLNAGSTAVGDLSISPFVEPNANSANEETTTYDGASGVIVSTNGDGAAAQLGFAACGGSYGHSIGTDVTVFEAIDFDAPGNEASFTGDGWFAQFVDLGGLAPGGMAQAHFVFRLADANGSVTDAGSFCPAAGDPPVEFLLPPPPPANDHRANAFVVGAVPYEYAQTTLGATDEPDEPGPSCAPGSASVWYVMTPAADGRFGVDTLLSDYDTVLAVYDAGLAELTCVDDSGSLQSVVAFDGTAGSTYYIQVSGYFGDTGGLVLRVTLPPANDERADALAIGALPYHNEQSTVGATSGVGDGASCAPIGATVWYSYTHTGLPRVVTVQTFGSSYDTVVAVQLSAGLLTPQVACNDDAAGTLQSRTSFPAITGQTYFVQVGGFFGDAGNLVLDVL